MTPSCSHSRTLLALILLLLLPSLPGRGQEDSGKKGGTGLSDDASLGRIVDREGAGFVRSRTHDRWIAARENLPLQEGDWVKTGVAGAHALTFKLRSGAAVVLGPAARVEVVSAASVRLLRGEMEGRPGKAVPLTVTDKDGKSVALTEKKVVSLGKGGLFSPIGEPRWLTAYRQNRSTDAMGSLLAHVDGRKVPLSIGVHKVTVDIRDQIARTVIEEVFINHTDQVLEGVFHFPLPADASISGFGMWIDGELVEADVVEKQRAREIFETILREKRDPALLEWTGGNLFKARVYPINARKKIRLVYTQVLPKSGRSYRYHFPLESEMLRAKPLKELSLTVTVSSSEILETVQSPSHACRIEQTPHAARISYEAQEVTPDRDFECRITTRPSKAPMTLISHRRGGDGYFMLLVNSPDEAFEQERETLPSTDPLNFLILADTSGSMRGAVRKTQAAFLQALFDSLGPQDRINLATCDTDLCWAGKEFLENSEENRSRLLTFLESRRALGWSDLETAFKEVLPKALENTQVAYGGDGRDTAGDGDAQTLARRLARLQGKARVHCAVPGSSYETVVLEALAGLGGGSIRSISVPAETATALLRPWLQSILAGCPISPPERSTSLPDAFSPVRRILSSTSKLAGCSGTSLRFWKPRRF